MKEVFVNMGEIHVLKQEGSLVTVGLGSCVGIALYDRYTKVGAMGHIFLSKSRNPEEAAKLPGKYADTGIPALVDAAVKAGAQKKRLEAKIAGGAHLFPNISAAESGVGHQNIAAVKEQLGKAAVPITGNATSGNHGRKMRLAIETGRVIVTAIGQQPREI